MPSGNSAHLSEEQLARIQDGEFPEREAGHLQSCVQCSNRVRDLRAAVAVYAEYRDSMRAPLLPAPPKPWQPLDALVAQHLASRPAKTLRWWWAVPALAAAAGLIVAVVLMHTKSRQALTRADELLVESARVELPERRLISMRMHGRTLVRPAVLRTEDPAAPDPDLMHAATLFAAAHYSWVEPLSARSYQAWRSRLPNKRDTVSVIRAKGKEEAYRLQTDTSEGVLRSASLTLRAKDLRPTNGVFQFENEAPLEMDEAQLPVPVAPQPPSRIAETPPIETPAGPEDTLHVLAALNEIGADVDDPVEVSMDSQQRHVVIRGRGIGPQRQQQIADAVKRLPRVALDFASASPGPPVDRPAVTEKSSSSMPAALRQRFEAALGGAVAFQEATDRILEASGSMLARAHAVETLATRFPPETEARLAPEDRQLLYTLRQRHLAELGRLVARIQAELQPLLAPSSNGPRALATEQTGIPALLASVQQTDQVLNRLLAGSYSQTSGEDMLRELRPQIERLDKILQAQPGPGR